MSWRPIGKLDKSIEDEFHRLGDWSSTVVSIGNKPGDGNPFNGVISVGSVTLDISAGFTIVNARSATPNSKVFLTPTNLDAAQENVRFVSSMKGSFRLEHASNTVVRTYIYMVVG